MVLWIVANWLINADMKKDRYVFGTPPASVAHDRGGDLCVYGSNFKSKTSPHVRSNDVNVYFN